MITDIDIFRETIRLARDVRIENSKDHPDEGLFYLGDIEVSNPTEGEQKLYEFLKKQNIDLLQRMRSIIYLGKDKIYELKQDAEKTINYMCKLLNDNYGWNDKEILIDQILESKKVDIYLQDGIDILISLESDKDRYL